MKSSEAYSPVLSSAGLRCPRCLSTFSEEAFGRGQAQVPCSCGAAYDYSKGFLDLLPPESSANFQIDHLPNWDLDSDFLGLKNYGPNQVDRDLSPLLLKELAEMAGTEGRGRVLDVGMGLISKGRLRSHFKGLLTYFQSYVGIEPSLEQLSYSLEPDRSRFFFVHGVGESVPFHDGYFDAVLILSVLDHCSSDAAVVEEAHRVLRPGGALLITLNNDRSWFKRVFKGRAADARKAASKEHNYFYSPEDLRQLLAGKFEISSPRCSRYLPFNFTTRSKLLGIPWLFTLKVADFLGRILMPNSGGNFAIFARRI